MFMKIKNEKMIEVKVSMVDYQSRWPLQILLIQRDQLK